MTAPPPSLADPPFGPPLAGAGLVTRAASLLLGPPLRALSWDPRPRGAVHRLAVIKPDHLGDVVLTLPALEALREAFPHAHLSYLAKRSSRPVLEGHPAIDQLVTFDAPWCANPGQPRASLAQLLAHVRRLRAQQLDLAVVLQDDPRSHLFAAATGASRRVGLVTRGGGAFLTDPLPPPGPTEHAARAHLRVAAAAGARAPGPVLPRLPARPGQRREGRDLAAARLGHRRPFALVHVGAGHPTKALPVGLLRALLPRLEAATGLSPLLLAGPADRARLASLGPSSPAVVGADLAQVAALSRAAGLFLGGDSGPAHLAAAAGAPVVAAFGWSVPARWRPLGRRARVVEARTCATPCGPRTPGARCECLEALDASRVLEACAAIADPRR